MSYSDTFLKDDVELETNKSVGVNMVSCQISKRINDNQEEKSTVRKLLGFLLFPIFFCLGEIRKEKILNWVDEVRPGSYFRPLLFSLVATLIIQPLAEKDERAFFLIVIFYGFILMSGLLFAAKTHPKYLYVLLPTVVISIGIFISFPFDLSNKVIHNLQIIAAFINTGFLIIVAALTSEIVVKTRNITNNELLASVAIYFIIGYVFAFIYFTSEMISPGQIVIEDESVLTHESTTFKSSDKYKPLSPFFYFSFVVITSVGFGDVLPMSPWTRALCNLEAVCGSFYLALLVSKLINRSDEN